jgi:hypothetical protein
LVEKNHCFRDLDYSLVHEVKMKSLSSFHLDRLKSEMVKVMNYHRRLRLDCNEGHELERMFLELRKP